MEYLDIVDENNNLTGERIERSIVHEKGIWHREVAVWIMNEKGEVLLQKRVATKKQNPNKWGICAGHVDAGETVESAIIRELGEELGVKLSIDDLELMYIAKEQRDFTDVNKNYVFYYVYFLRTKLKVEDYKIELKELSEVKYISFDEFKEIVKTKNPEFTFSNMNQTVRLAEELEKRI